MRNPFKKSFCKRRRAEKSTVARGRKVTLKWVYLFSKEQHWTNLSKSEEEIITKLLKKERSHSWVCFLRNNTGQTWGRKSWREKPLSSDFFLFSNNTEQQWYFTVQKPIYPRFPANPFSFWYSICWQTSILFVDRQIQKTQC